MRHIRVPWGDSERRKSHPPWKRQYHRVERASFISLVGSWLSFASVPLVLLETQGVRQAALGLILDSGTRVLFGPISGRIADFFSRRRTMLINNAMFLALSLLTGMCLFLGSYPLWMMLSIQISYGFGAAIGNAAMPALRNQLVPGDQLQWGKVRTNVQGNIAAAIGMMLGTLLIIPELRPAIFLLDALSFVPMLWVLGKMRVYQVYERSERTSFWRADAYVILFFLRMGVRRPRLIWESLRDLVRALKLKLLQPDEGTPGEYLRRNPRARHCLRLELITGASARYGDIVWGVLAMHFGGGQMYFIFRVVAFAGAILGGWWIKPRTGASKPVKRLSLLLKETRLLKCLKKLLKLLRLLLKCLKKVRLLKETKALKRLRLLWRWLKKLLKKLEELKNPPRMRLVYFIALCFQGATILYVSSPWWVLTALAMGVQGFFSAALRVAGSTLLVQKRDGTEAPQEMQGRLYSRQSINCNLGIIVSQALIALLIVPFGVGWPASLMALTGLILIAALWKASHQRNVRR